MLNTLIALSLLLPAQGDAGPFHFSGPAAQYLAPGAAVAPVTKGLPFSIVLSEQGAKVGSSEFVLKGTDWKGSADLKLTDLKFTDGTLRGVASLANKAGQSLQGLRLDMVSAIEEYRGKDEKGQEKLFTRAQEYKFDSPLLFGDLLPGEGQGEIEFTVSGLKFSPETTTITLSGVLSGLRHVGAWVPEDGYVPGSLEFAPDGTLYITHYETGEITKLDTARKGKALYDIGSQPTGLARHPSTGDLYSTAISSKIVKVHGSDGKLKREFGENVFENFVNRIRFDRQGRLYVSEEFGGIRRLNGEKLDRKIMKIAGDDVDSRDFDLDGKGVLWIVSETGFYRIDESDQGKKIASVGSWKLGGVQAPTAVRASPEGLIYVGEDESQEGAGNDRIVVFDGQGRFVRVFGRAGKGKKQEGWHPGQVKSVSVIGFAPDGTIHISQGAENGGVQMYKGF
ncbi:MAG TPA: hypothetical protein VEX38_03045 [Fimbriimonadaceae bacterium]|nr:hypothetical protein [Fimbriimonadaceae bacterium]